MIIPISLAHGSVIQADVAALILTRSPGCIEQLNIVDVNDLRAIRPHDIDKLERTRSLNGVVVFRDPDDDTDLAPDLAADEITGFH